MKTRVLFKVLSVLLIVAFSLGALGSKPVKADMLCNGAPDGTTGMSFGTKYTCKGGNAIYETSQPAPTQPAAPTQPVVQSTSAPSGHWEIRKGACVWIFGCLPDTKVWVADVKPVGGYPQVMDNGGSTIDPDSCVTSGSTTICDPASGDKDPGAVSVPGDRRPQNAYFPDDPGICDAWFNHIEGHGHLSSLGGWVGVFWITAKIYNGDLIYHLFSNGANDTTFWFSGGKGDVFGVLADDDGATMYSVKKDTGRNKVRGWEYKDKINNLAFKNLMGQCALKAAERAKMTVQFNENGKLVPVKYTYRRVINENGDIIIVAPLPIGVTFPVMVPQPVLVPVLVP